ncbi:MAG: site-2 protease family protein [Chloroflexota bacterium]|nr:site-2 protease family protein [Dehalococcoidia bacterium]MDW8252823.1 site-2 protease family protein [Chloroflexota bacterium]
MNGTASTNNTSPRRDPPPTMGSFTIGRVFGIPIRIHFTFFLLLAFLGWLEAQQSGNVFLELAFIVSLFGCVLLHELGHALTARAYGIRTVDITLYPIGGIARLSSMGKPNQEFWIALAGPMVNVAIAAVLWGGMVVVVGRPPALGPFFTEDFVQRVFIANVLLAAFNLLPAFPMDGGRILRALLAQRLGIARGTRIAATVGQMFAVVFGIVGLFSLNLFLVLIAFFLFIGASGEAVMAQTQDVLAGARVRDAMITRFDTLRHGQVLGDAAELLISGTQQDFPVVFGDQVLGVLPRDRLLAALARGGRDTYVSEAMVRDFVRVTPNDDLAVALEHFASSRIPLLVFDDGHLVGMLTPENVSEFVMIRQSLAQASLMSRM